MSEETVEVQMIQHQAEIIRKYVETLKEINAIVLSLLTEDGVFVSDLHKIKELSDLG